MSRGGAESGEAVGGVVAVAGGVDHAQLGAHRLREVAARIVGVARAAASVADLAQATEAIGAGRAARGAVPSEADVLAGAGIGDAGQAVERVVRVAGADAARVGASARVAGGIERVVGGAAVGRDFAREVAQAVDGVGGGGVVGRDNAGELVAAVVAELRVAARRVGGGDAAQAAQRVPGQRGDDRVGRAVARVLHGGGVALRVVAEDRALAGRAEVLQQAAQGVEDARLLPGDAAVGVEGDFARDVAGVVAGEHAAVAEVVGDLDGAARAVVGVVHVAAVGQGDAAQLPVGVMVEAGRLTTDAAGGEPAARVVGKFARHPVGVDQRAHPAMRVVAGEAGDVPQGVGDALQVARAEVCGGGGVVSVGGGVGHIGARAVDAEHLAPGVVGVGPDARGAAEGRSKTQTAIGVGGGLLGAAAHQGGGSAGRCAARAGVAVKSVGAQAQGLGDASRQPPTGVPFGADGPGHAGHRSAGAVRAGQALHPPGFQVARAVVAVAAQVAVEVAVGDDVAVGVMRQASGRAALGDGVAPNDILDRDEGFLALGAQGIEQGRAAVGVVGDLHPTDAAGVPALAGPPLGVKAEGGMTHAVFVGDAGQGGRVGAGLVVVAAHGVARIRHRQQVVESAVGVGGDLTGRIGHLGQTATAVVGEAQAAAGTVGDLAHLASRVVGQSLSQTARLGPHREPALAVVGLGRRVFQDQTPAAVGQALERGTGIGLRRRPDACAAAGKTPALAVRSLHRRFAAAQPDAAVVAGAPLAAGPALRRERAVEVPCQPQRESAAALVIDFDLKLVAGAAVDRVGAVAGIAITAVLSGLVVLGLGGVVDDHAVAGAAAASAAADLEVVGARAQRDGCRAGAEEVEQGGKGAAALEDDDTVQGGGDGALVAGVGGSGARAGHADVGGVDRTAPRRRRELQRTGGGFVGDEKNRSEQTRTEVQETQAKDVSETWAAGRPARLDTSPDDPGQHGSDTPAHIGAPRRYRRLGLHTPLRRHRSPLELLPVRVTGLDRAARTCRRSFAQLA